MKKLSLLFLSLFFAGCFFGGKSQKEEAPESPIETIADGSDTTTVAAADSTQQTAEDKPAEEDLYGEKSLLEQRRELQVLIEEKDELTWQIMQLDSAIAGKPLPPPRQGRTKMKDVMSDTSNISTIEESVTDTTSTKKVSTDTTSTPQPPPVDIVPTPPDTTGAPPDTSGNSPK